MDACRFRLRPLWLLVAVALLVWSGVLDGHAGKPMYTYVDDRGNLVATDRIENVPPRYRDRVKVTGDAGGPAALRETASEAVRSVSSVTKEGVLYAVIDRLPARVIPGLSTYQSVILIVGFLAMILFYGAGKLTGGTFWRVFMPWAIGITAVLTLFYMFVSDLSNQVAARYPTKSTGSIIKNFQAKSQDISEQKQRRLKEFDQKTQQD
jgi:hypothetical protein